MTIRCRIFGHKVDLPIFIPPAEHWSRPPTTRCPRCGEVVLGNPAGTFKRMMREVGDQKNRERLAFQARLRKSATQAGQKEEDG